MSSKSSQPEITPVGIDLGTTFSAVAWLDVEGRPSTVRNAEGELTTPSVVFFDRTAPIVGLEAVEAGIAEPDRLAQFVKRSVGESMFEKKIRGEDLPSEVILALILQKLRQDAELKLGPIRKAVVTVPAFFNEPCRKATMDAGRLAGLDVLDIINEPTAAAITYGVEQGFLTRAGESRQKEVILVFDLGGGTFDVTVMQIDGSQYTAIASAGDVYLGGADWDMRIVDYIASEFQAEFGRDPRDDPSAAQELLQKANQAKHSLTAREEISIFFNHDGNRLRRSLTREKFEQLTQDLMERTQLTLSMVLNEAGMDWDEITRVLLVGGSTRMPAVGRMLEEISGLPVDRSLSPDEAVAHGAAIYAGLVLKSGSARDGMTVTNVSSHDLGVMGTETATGRKRRGVMIARNSKLPAKKTRGFATAKDNQQSVRVDIVEGGDDSGNNATKIGTCVVRDLPPNLPKGTPVEVTFRYATNGRLQIGARVPAVDRKAELSLNRFAGLSEIEFERWHARINQGFGDDTIVPPEPPAPPPAEGSKRPIRKLTAADEVFSEQPAPLKKRPTTKRRKKAPQAPAKEQGEESSPPKSDWRKRSNRLGGD